MAKNWQERRKVKQTVVVGIGQGWTWPSLDLTVDIWQYPDVPITNRQMRNALRTRLMDYLIQAYPEDGR